MSTVSDAIDYIEQQCDLNGVKKPERFILLSWMSEEINGLTGKIDADFFQVNLNPMIVTSEGVREYGLPDNFPDNFVRHAGMRYYKPLLQGGDLFVCKISDGTTERILNYESNALFYSHNLIAEANSRPQIYTISKSRGGHPSILLSPPPDDNNDENYEIGGVYVPTDWSLKDEDDIPPFLLSNHILHTSVLKHLIPRFEAEYREDLADLMMSAAQARPSQFHPVQGRNGLNQYTLMRRRF